MSSGVIVRLRWPQRPQICVLVIVAATLPVWFNTLRMEKTIKAIGGDPMRGPNRTTVALEEVSDCFGRLAPGAVVLAPWDQSGVLAGLGNVRVIGSGYCSDFRRRPFCRLLRIVYHIRVERFQALVLGTEGIQFLLVRRPEWELCWDIVVSFVTLLGHIPTENEVRANRAVESRQRSPRPLIVSCPGIEEREEDHSVVMNRERLWKNETARRWLNSVPVHLLALATVTTYCVAISLEAVKAVIS